MWRYTVLLFCFLLEFHILRQEEAFVSLNDKAATLKKILGRIPNEIYDRRRFLETIKLVDNVEYNVHSYMYYVITYTLENLRH